MKALTSSGNNLLVAASELETRTPNVKRDHESRGLNATIEVHRSIVCTGSCRADNKVSSLGAVDFFFDENMINILGLEEEVTKTCAILTLFGERLVRDTEERGGRDADTIAAGLMMLQMDQCHALVKKFHAALDELKQEASNVLN